MSATILILPVKPRTLAELYCRQQSTALHLLLKQEAAARKLDADWLREFEAEQRARIWESF